MSKRDVPKRTPPPHNVIVDTSILWYEDKAAVVHPKFEDFWDKQTGSTDLRLLVPDVVRGELLFQQTTSAVKRLQKISDDVLRLNQFASTCYRSPATEREVMQAVEDRLVNWAKARKVQFLSTPTSNIDWPRLIEESIWHKPPFALDSSRTDMEKGFRDALIMETVVEYVRHNTHDTNVFLCADGLLREATEARLESIDCLFFSSIDEFASYVRLTEEQLTERFIRAIIHKAKTRFFVKDDLSSIYYRDGLYSAIVREFQDDLVPASKDVDLALADLLMRTNKQPWEMKFEKILLGNPQFQRIETARVFHWRSVLHIMRLYSREIPPKVAGALGDMLANLSERLVVVDVAIDWHADVRSNGAFYDCVVDGTELLERKSEVVTDQLKDKYKLP